MMPVGVLELDASLEAEYSAFVLGHPDAMIYWTLEFREFLRRIVPASPRYLVAQRDGAIQGVLPMFVAHHPEFGTAMNSLPWWGTHGGCLVRGGDHEARNVLVNALAHAATASASSYCTVILSPAETRDRDAYTSVLAPAVIEHRIGQITELPAAGPDLEERLAMVCHSKTRNLIRKSLKQQFVYEESDTPAAWQFLHQTHDDNLRAIGGMPKPREHFEAMRGAIPRRWRRLIVVRREGRPVAALLLLLFNRTVEYITPVIVHEFRSLQPLSFAIWMAMLDAARQGYRWWNWGGTWLSQRSLHHFKAGWGATDAPYSYIVKASPAAVRQLRAQRSAVAAAFPYFFLYPYEALN